MDARVLFTWVSIAALAACSSAPGAPATPIVTPPASSGSARPAALATGPWGGPGVQMTVDEQSVTVEFDCARGGIETRPTLDASGRFEAAGFYVQERGGPIRVDDAANREPATYIGALNGTTLTLTATVPGRSLTLGPLTLEAKATGRLHKCL